MNINVKELIACYPFLPTPSVDNAVKNIRDIHVEYTLPAKDYNESDYAIDSIKSTLVSIEEDYLILSINIVDYGVTDVVKIPVYIGIDTIPENTNYAILSAPVSDTTLTHTYRLHPDCIVIRQETPKISIDERYDYSINPSIAPTSRIHYNDNLIFNSGHHIGFSIVNNNLVVTGGDTAGTGDWRTYPFKEFRTYTHRAGKGLRSICGITDTVNIAPKGDYITVDAVKDSSCNIKLTIGHV